MQRKTYVEATVNKVDVLKAREVKREVVIYNVLKDDLYRFERAFMGRVKVPGSSYNIQKLFHVEGYFSVKVTPLGVNLCLLEASEERELDALVSGANGWLEQWLSKVRRWRI